MGGQTLSCPLIMKASNLVLPPMYLTYCSACEGCINSLGLITERSTVQSEDGEYMTYKIIKQYFRVDKTFHFVA